MPVANVRIAHGIIYLSLSSAAFIIIMRALLVT